MSKEKIEQKIADEIRAFSLRCHDCHSDETCFICYDQTAKAILALIEQEQKAMREALDAAKVHLLSGANDIGKDAVLVKIDAALKGGSHE